MKNNSITFAGIANIAVANVPPKGVEEKASFSRGI